MSTAPAELDREARFAAFAASHRERALRLAWRLVGGDMAAAEDVTQDALVKAYRGLPQFRDEAALSTWFYRILVRQAYSFLRWRRVRERFGGEVPENPPDTAPTPQSDPALRRRIADALAALPRTQRDAFLLVHLEGFTVNEAAEIMGRAPGTLKSNLHRARMALRRRLDDVVDSRGESR
ncbi:MAG TPA: RNA polymerase sigma factor [Myxococcota bacterium]|nr:RNA polymerase sigma factor [Myxococcota bacterium]